MTLSIGEEVRVKPNKSPIDPKLTKQADDLAVAMGKVTTELNKVDNILSAGAANGGVIPDDMNPEDQPSVPKGGLPTITVNGAELFKAPDTKTAEDPLSTLGDKAANAASALQDLYDKLTMSPPDSALIAGAAYGLVNENDFTAEGDGMGTDMGEGGDDAPLTVEEEVAKEQEKQVALNELKDESLSEEEARKKREQEAAKKNMIGLIGMTKVGQKTMGAINSATALKNAVTNVAEGITTAVKSAPFPLNVPAIAFATAQGASSIATIKGQFHSGIDSVPENGTYLLEQGERVVDKRLNADLKNYMGKSGNSNTSVSAPVTLNFAGEPSEDAVYENRMAIEGILRDIYDEYAIKSPF